MIPEKITIEFTREEIFEILGDFYDGKYDYPEQITLHDWNEEDVKFAIMNK